MNKQVLVPSMSRPGINHVVSLETDASGREFWSCDCTGYGVHGHCWHVLAAADDQAAASVASSGCAELRRKAAELQGLAMSYCPRNLAGAKALYEELKTLGAIIRRLRRNGKAN
jgi:hypothetical protein